VVLLLKAMGVDKVNLNPKSCSYVTPSMLLSTASKLASVYVLS
jgi:hypothetical protein